MDADRPRGAGGSKYGALHRTEGQERPAGRGNALLHAEEPAGEEALPARRARKGQAPPDRVWPQAHGEAEGPLVLRVSEKQFRRAYERATRMQGVSGENLLRLMELRMDNVVYRMGFSTSRPQARQLVVHGHFQLNGRKHNIPSAILKPGDVITVREKS